MPRRIALGLALGLTALASGAAHAQTAPVTQDDQGITVTGQLEVPPKVAQRYVRGISTTFEGQLARFHDPVCPLVMGLPEKFGLVIANRIRAVAEEAGAQKPSNDKCTPNLIIIVSDDADKLVKAMRKKLPGMFSRLRPNEFRRAMREGPVHVWNTVETQNEDGTVSISSGMDSNGDAPSMTVNSVSMVNASTLQAVVQSVVVFDDEALLEKSLVQIAEYVAMRSLAGARPPAQGLGADTILTLFNPDAVSPAGMTSVDKSYLAGVYRANPLGRGNSQRSAISSRITRDAKRRSGAN